MSGLPGGDGDPVCAVSWMRQFFQNITSDHYFKGYSTKVTSSILLFRASMVDLVLWVILARMEKRF
jgi:hypothetical protein